MPKGEYERDPITRIKPIDDRDTTSISGRTYRGRLLSHVARGYSIRDKRIVVNYWLDACGNAHRCSECADRQLCEKLYVDLMVK